jgi:lipopolysaccharide transport system permease protein
VIKKIKSNFYAGFFLAKVHFARRYKRFHLGVFWTFFPTFLVLIGAYISSKQLDLESFGFKYNYVLYVMLPFVVFRGITETFDVSQKLIQLSFILQRSITIKSHHIFTGCIFASIFYLTMDILVIFIIMIIFNSEINGHYIIYLFFFFYSIFIGVIISCFLGPLCMLIYDLRFISKFLRVIILAGTPIFYILPKDGIVSIINNYNPFTYIVLASRDVVLTGMTTEVIYMLYSFLLSVLVFFIVIIFFEFQIRVINSTAVRGVVGQTYAWQLVLNTSKKR